MRHQVSEATVEKSESAPGTGVTEAYSDTRGERRRVHSRKEHRSSKHSAGYGAHMEGGRTRGIRWRTRGAKGGVCSVTRESHYETWRRCTRRVRVESAARPAGVTTRRHQDPARLRIARRYQPACTRAGSKDSIMAPIQGRPPREAPCPLPGDQRWCCRGPVGGMCGQRCEGAASAGQG